MSTNGKNTTDAAVYRRAAQIMERGEFENLADQSCCWAIALAKTPDVLEIDSKRDPHGQRMKAIFAPSSGDAFWMADNNPDCDDQNAHRILALCFMAVMVERGDA